MEKVLTVWGKKLVLIVAVLFIAGGWFWLFYQEKQGVPVAFNQGDYVRLHILANSDSIQDQQLKLKVRDEVIAYLTPHVKDAINAREAENIIVSRREEIILVARKCLADNGIDYPVELQIGTFNFPVRTYGSLELPAGEYQAVRILLGEAAGQNWWCVLFPPLCFIDGTNVLAAPLTSNNTQTAADGQIPEIRWKLAELFKK